MLRDWSGRKFQSSSCEKIQVDMNRHTFSLNDSDWEKDASTWILNEETEKKDK